VGGRRVRGGAGVRVMLALSDARNDARATLDAASAPFDRQLCTRFGNYLSCHQIRQPCRFADCFTHAFQQLASLGKYAAPLQPHPKTTLLLATLPNNLGLLQPFPRRQHAPAQTVAPQNPTPPRSLDAPDQLVVARVHPAV
jgi:hypothetical protein